jgi:hypothetical protein
MNGKKASIKLCEKAALAYFKVPYCHPLEETGKSGHHRHDSR